jgi:hypothetical protein
VAGREDQADKLKRHPKEVLGNMYCSICGAQVKAELNYCSRCGAKLFKADSEESRVSETLSGSLGYIGGFGLVGFIFVALVLVKNNVPANVLAAISFFYLAALFGICYLILQQIRISTRKSEAASFIDFPADSQIGEARTTAQLEEPKAMPISVTENTTKTLDKALR